MDTQPMEILLVEDNEDDILLEQEALSDAKLVNLMCVVRDGEEAMAYLSARANTKMCRCQASSFWTSICRRRTALRCSTK